MRTKKIIIPQKPIPQARPRVTRWATYDINTDKKNWIRLQIQKQFNEKLDCPIELEMHFFLPIPKSTSVKKKELMLEGLIAHTKKPDIDNLIILLLNCMTDIVYKDDNQVYQITSSKQYDLNPRSEVIIKWNESKQGNGSASGLFLKE